MIDWEALGSYKRKQLITVVSDVGDLVEEKLARIRLGVYSEEQDGSVQEILEEIERILR